MYLSLWKRKQIFEKIPLLKGNKTYFEKSTIHNPHILDYWNFFVKNKKVRYMTQMVKENPINSLITEDGDNVLEVALNVNYLPLFKESISRFDLTKIDLKNEDNISVLDRIFTVNFSIYKEALTLIKKQNLEFLFNHNHMEILISGEVNKMIFFEKIFPDLFMKLYSKKIDNLHPHFQHVLMKNNLLKNRLNKKLKKKSNKKVFLKI